MINRPAAGHDPCVGYASAAHPNPSELADDLSSIDPSPGHPTSPDTDPSTRDAADAPRPLGEVRSRAFVDGHLDFVWRLLRRLGVPSAEVDDAAQQVFIIAVKRLADIVEGGERSFLYGTALRVASTFRRSASRRRRKLGDLQLETPSSGATPADELERREALALLDEALAGLTDDLRRVFVLCEIEEIPGREVALLENLPPGTVASRLRRARGAFAARLGDLRAKEPRKP